MRTIKARLIVILASAVVFGSIALIGVVKYGFDTVYKTSIDKSLSSLSDSVFQTVRTAMNIGDPAIVKDVIENANKVSGVSNLHIIKSKSVSELFGSAPEEIKDEQILEVFKTKTQIQVEGANDTQRLLKPLIATDECLKCHANSQKGDVLGVMDLGITTAEIEKTINGVIWAVIGILFVSSIAFLPMLFYIFKKLLFDKLESLKATAESLDSGEGDLGKRLEIQGQDEIAEASIHINNFLEQIQTFERALNDVIYNASSGRSFNKIDLSKLNGDLLGSAKIVNNAIEQLEQNYIENEQNVLAKGLAEMSSSHITNNLVTVQGELSSNVSTLHTVTTQVSDIADDASKNAMHIKEVADSTNSLVETISKIDSSLDMLTTKTDEIASVVGLIKTLQNKQTF